MTEPLAPFARWTPQRKAELIQRINAGQVAPETAMARHGLSAAELAIWSERYARHGLRGLSIKNLQEIRA